jgi:hypothetical protein
MSTPLPLAAAVEHLKAAGGVAMADDAGRLCVLHWPRGAAHTLDGWTDDGADSFGEYLRPAWGGEPATRHGSKWADLNALRDVAQHWAEQVGLAKEDGYADEIEEASAAFEHHAAAYSEACKRAGQPDLGGTTLDHPQPPTRGTVWRP